MPDISISLLRKTDSQGALRPEEKIVAHSDGSEARAVLLEGGMSSGEPSVAFIIPVAGGAVAVLETSLALFQGTARALVAMAEAQLDWTLPA